MAGRSRSLAFPELFLGLLAIAVAVVVTAKIFADTIHDARHIRDTISVTGSARKPITSNLVRWSVSVSTEGPKAAPAARRLRGQAARVRAYLVGKGIPARAISPSVVTSEELVEQLPHHRRKISYRVSQELDVSTRRIDVVEGAATGLGRLLEVGIGVSAEPLQYVSTELTDAKLDALAAATEDARRRAEILVKGLGGKLGPMRSTSLGVYQITPRDSTDVSDYGINDTSSREKDVNAVVTATFAVKR
ncbi:MAG TPA: SIMPL domain-containing protein [Gaiellaceae bacterium]